MRKIIRGYSTCWYCDGVVVDAYLVTIHTGDGPLTVAVCADCLRK